MCPAINIRQTGAAFSRLRYKISSEDVPPEVGLIVASTMLGFNQKHIQPEKCEIAS